MSPLLSKNTVPLIAFILTLLIDAPTGRRLRRRAQSEGFGRGGQVRPDARDGCWGAQEPFLGPYRRLDGAEGHPEAVGHALHRFSSRGSIGDAADACGAATDAVAQGSN